MIKGKIKKFFLIPFLILALTFMPQSIHAEEISAEDTVDMITDISENEAVFETSVSEETAENDRTEKTDEERSDLEEISQDPDENVSDEPQTSEDNETDFPADENTVTENQEDEAGQTDDTQDANSDEEQKESEKTEASEDINEEKASEDSENSKDDSQTEKEIKAAAAVTQDATVEKCYFGDMDRSGNFTFHAEGISVPAGIEKIKVAVWRYTDKRDRLFYPLKDGVATINIKDHDYLFGNYKARLYIWDKNDKMWCYDLCTRYYDTIRASANGVSLDINNNREVDFTIRATDVQSPKGIKVIKALVWSDEDQGNRRWYANFTETSPGNYSAAGSFANHGFKEGNYQVILYIVDNTGKTQSVAKTSKEIRAGADNLTVKVDTVNKIAQFNLSSVHSYGLIDHVEYAVWTEGSDQKDLKWYTATPSGGYFLYRINLADYGVNGTYNVHVYATTKEGNYFYVVGKSFDVNCFSNITTCTLKRQSYSKMGLIVKNANVNGVPADTVKIAVWSDVASVGSGNIQDDLVWYDTVRNSDGSFTCTVDRSRHISSGRYTAHVYAFAGDESACVAGQQFGLLKTAAFAGEYATVARNCILAVETGGQVYGNARYDDFTEAYHISAAETGITIGAGQWMGINAVRLLLDIRSADPVLFAQLDSYGISIDLDNLLNMPQSTWNYYGGGEVGGFFKSGDAKATAIQRLISSSVGIAVQNATVERNIAGYISKAKELGVIDIEGQIFCANICHLGGSGAMSRIINATQSQGLDLTVENLWSVMEQDIYDTSSNNQVGDQIYRSRHLKIIGWIYQYLN